MAGHLQGVAGDARDVLDVDAGPRRRSRCGCPEELGGHLGILRLGREVDVPVGATGEGVVAHYADRQGEGRHPGGVDVAVLGTQAEHVGLGEARVDRDVVHHAAQHRLCPQGVVEALGLDRADQHPEKGLVPADPAEVGQRVRVPLPVGVVLQVACPDDGQRLEPVQELAAGLRDVQAGERVLERHREVHRDPPDGVDDVLELVEVDRHVVIDRDAEAPADRRDQVVRAVVQRRVDLAHPPRHAVRGQRDEQVAGNGQQGGSAGRWIEVEHHRDVAAGATHLLGAAEEGGVPGSEPGAGVVPHDQDVHGPRLARRLRRPEVREVDLAHLVEAEPGVPGAGRHRDPHEQHEDDAGRDQAADVIPPAGEPPSLHRR